MENNSFILLPSVISVLLLAIMCDRNLWGESMLMLMTMRICRWWSHNTRGRWWWIGGMCWMMMLVGWGGSCGCCGQGNRRNYTSAFHPKQIWYRLDLLAWAIYIILVHVGTQIAGIWITFHQMIDMSGSHIETPTIGAVWRIHCLAGQFHRFWINIDGAWCIGCKKFLPNALYSFFDFTLR